MYKRMSEIPSKIAAWHYLLGIMIGSVILGYHLSTNKVAEYFIYENLYVVEKGLREGRLNLHAYTPAYDMILYLIAKVGGYQPIQVIYLPIGIMIFPLITFVLARRLFGSPLIAFLTALYVLLEPTHVYGMYSVFAYVWVFPHYALSTLLLVDMFEKKRENRETALVLILIFFGTTLIHYTIPVWIIILFVLFSLLSFLQGRGKKSPGLILTSLSILSYLTLNEVFYGLFLPTLVRKTVYDAFLEPLYRFIDTFGAYLSGKERVLEKYEYVQPSGVYGFLRILMFAYIASPIVIWGFAGVRKVFKTKKLRTRRTNTHLYLQLTFLITAFLTFMIYAIVFNPGLHFFIFMGPFMMLNSFVLLGIKRKFKALAMIGLLIISTGTFLTFDFEAYHMSIGYSSIEPSATHLFSTTAVYRLRLLAGTDILYAYKLAGATFNISLTWVHFNSENYEIVISKNSNLKNIADFLIVDKRSSRYGIITEGRKHFIPLARYSNVIDNNAGMMRIYDDNTIWIFKPI